MGETFDYDVFLSHSSKDEAIVRPIAERLRADGLRVWLDEWEIKAGDSIPAQSLRIFCTLCFITPAVAAQE